MRKEWTTDEARRLYALRARRVRMADIAQLLGRSTDSLYAFLRYVPSCPGQNARTKPVERETWRPKAEPSERLRVATLIAIATYANNNLIDVDTAANRLLYARAA